MTDKSNKRGYSRYILYGIVLCLFLWLTIIPLVWKAVTYEKTGGIVRSITFRESPGRKKNTRYYPVVEYWVNNKQYTCLGSRFQHDEVYVGDKVPVLYNPADPSKAYVYTFLGFWSPEAIIVIPGIILLTMFFQLGIIPRRYRL